METLRVELAAWGIDEAYDIGDGVTLCIWLGLVVTYRNGSFIWREGAERVRHPAAEPRGCAERLAARYSELRSAIPIWWNDIQRAH